MTPLYFHISKIGENNKFSEKTADLKLYEKKTTTANHSYVYHSINLQQRE